jgi:hypothetical protein
VTEPRRSRTRAERPAFEDELLRRVYELAKKNPDESFPNVFQIGRQLGATEDDVVSAMNRWIHAGHLRWKTSRWAQLTPSGIAAVEKDAEAAGAGAIE